MTGTALSNGFFVTSRGFKSCAKATTVVIEKKVSMDDQAKAVFRTPQDELDHNFKEAYTFWRKVAESGARLPEIEMAWNMYCAARDMRLFNPKVPATYKKSLT
jgi:hypothetical protein